MAEDQDSSKRPHKNNSSAGKEPREKLDRYLVVLLSFLRATRTLPAFGLLTFGGRGFRSTLALLKRRRLVVPAMVTPIGVAVGFS